MRWYAAVIVFAGCALLTACTMTPTVDPAHPASPPSHHSAPPLTSTPSTPSTAAPAPTTISADSAQGLVYRCGAQQRIVVTGSDDEIRLLGTCTELDVDGARDQVRVDRISKIDFSQRSTDNVVAWTSAPAGRPEEDGELLTNVVTRTGSSAPGAIVITGSTGTYGCANRSMTIKGKNATATLTGTCKAVTVIGMSDTVHVAAASAITVVGTDIRVTWQRGRAPVVHTIGVNDTVTRG
jgi:hypothetical protein